MRNSLLIVLSFPFSACWRSISFIPVFTAVATSFALFDIVSTNCSDKRFCFELQSKYYLIQSKRQPPNLKKLLTRAEYGEVLSGTFNCSDKRCECCNFLLINDHYTFKNVQITFKLKNHFTCDSFNLIYVIICDTCKEEYIGETGEGKTKLRDRVRVYRQHIRQPHYQQLKVEGHLRVCGNGKFRIFPLLQMRSKDTNLRRSYETRFQQKFKTKLNKL